MRKGKDGDGNAVIRIWGGAYRRTLEKHDRWAGEKAKAQQMLATVRMMNLDPESLSRANTLTGYQWV